MHGSKPTTQRKVRGERFWQRFWPFRKARQPLREELDADAVRVARQIRLSGRRVVGCLPTSSKVPTDLLCRHLTRALVGLYRATVAWVDLPGAYRSEIERTAPHRLDDDGMFMSCWVDERLFWIAPHDPGQAGVRFQLVELLLEHLNRMQERPFDQVLVDLRGFDRLGELLETSSLLQGVIIVARMGHTKRVELERLHEVLPAEQNLGVLLIR